MSPREQRGFVKTLGAAGALLLSVGACAPATASPPRDPLAGQFTGSGGGGALTHVRALTEGFGQLHPGVVWLLEDVGSDASVALVASGEVDLGFLSRDPRQGESERVKPLSIGAVGTAVAINPASPVNNLTKDDVRKIFAGEITDWSEVGGVPGAIKVLIREREATTRVSFEAYFFEGQAVYSKDAIEVYELEETLAAIGSFRNAIGMVTMSDATNSDPRVRLLALDGVAPSKDNLYSGIYKIRRPLYLISNPDPDRVKPTVRAFLDFVASPEGQRVLERI